MKLTSVAMLRGLLSQHNLRPKKHLGQHFLVDAGVLDRLVAVIDPQQDETILEVGAGAGALTARLAERCSRIIAVEVDPGLGPVLNAVLKSHSGVTIWREDIMEIPVTSLAADKIVGNLPYYLTSPLLFRLFKPGIAARKLVFMVQEEVAGRITASPGTKEYGVLSVVCAYRAKTERVMRVSPSCYWPQPKVYSAVVSFDLFPDRPEDLALFALAETAFAQRRKTLANNLCQAGLEKGLVHRIMRGAGIDPSRRGETLTVDEFQALKTAIALELPGFTLRPPGRSVKL